MIHIRSPTSAYIITKKHKMRRIILKKHIQKTFAVMFCLLMTAAIPCMAFADNFVDTQQEIQVRYEVTPDMIPTVPPVMSTPIIVTPPPTIRPIIQTGDDNNIMLISLVAAGSLLVAIMIYVYIRKTGGIKKHEK